MALVYGVVQVSVLKCTAVNKRCNNNRFNDLCLLTVSYRDFLGNDTWHSKLKTFQPDCQFSKSARLHENYLFSKHSNLYFQNWQWMWMQILSTVYVSLWITNIWVGTQTWMFRWSPRWPQTLMHTHSCWRLLLWVNILKNASSIQDGREVPYMRLAQWTKVTCLRETLLRHC